LLLDSLSRHYKSNANSPPSLGTLIQQIEKSPLPDAIQLSPQNLDAKQNPVDLFTKEIYNSHWTPIINIAGIDIVSICLQPYQNQWVRIGYPKNAIFCFPGYTGLEDNVRIVRDIKHAAFLGGTTLRTYSSHSRHREGR
jgi:hypothetical protein